MNDLHRKGICLPCPRTCDLIGSMAKAKKKTAVKTKPSPKKKAPVAKKPAKAKPKATKATAKKPVSKAPSKKIAPKRKEATLPVPPKKAIATVAPPAKQKAPLVAKANLAGKKPQAPLPPKAAPAVAKVPSKLPAKEPAPSVKPAAKAATKGKETKPKGPIIAVMTGVEPIGGPTRTLKRALKERFTVEFYLRATPGSLYDMISTPSGLSEWFCDDVDVRGDQFTFRWGNDSQGAQCLGRKFGELMRFQWDEDEDAGAFFELRIRIDPMTNETCLMVTDHAWPKDLDDAKALWGSQIHTLQRMLGA